ncbi:hypothetical protein [Stakelama marina]|uniref:hypothetical protein n=1 Tax=Stakelama marina TaxID=2826939 RepID=UPI00325F963B
MRRFFDPAQLRHRPASELHNGALVAYSEAAERAEAIASAVGATELPADHGEAPILAVHDAGYVDFLKTAFDRWQAAGRRDSLCLAGGRAPPARPGAD